MLEIEPGELMAEYRPSLTPEGRDGLKAEIFLYDTLAGGAGVRKKHNRAIIAEGGRVHGGKEAAREGAA
jgi:hypothetical protein